MRKCFSILVCLIVYTMASAQYIPRFDLQGHRGARGMKPENTIPAFMAALECGVTTLEMDVVVTLDKELIVSHEPWMSASICLQEDGEEITGDQEKTFNIYKMTVEEIQAFDCGSRGNDRFPQQEKTAVTKPLLREVIITVENYIRSTSRYEVDYNIEIKSQPESDGIFHPHPEAYSDLVYELVNQYLPLERVIIQSFDFRVLRYWHRKYPNVRLAALVENNRSIESNLASLGFTPNIYSPDYTLLTKSKIAYLRRHEIRVIPWTVNEIEEMKKLKSWRVDGIITDYPKRAQDIGLGLAGKK